MKITQMVGVGNSLFALTSSGELWEFDTQERAWMKCKSMVSDEEVLKEKKQLLVDSLEVSNRVLNALKKNKINTVGELLSLDKSGINSIAGLGEKSMFELKNALLLLEMDV
ncbi:DNA-directed RNA polymerase subunit alpha C-terminal domain-containing protein [Neisseriaceae bacterium CLB008]